MSIPPLHLNKDFGCLWILHVLNCYDFNSLWKLLQYWNSDFNIEIRLQYWNATSILKWRFQYWNPISILKSDFNIELVDFNIEIAFSHVCLPLPVVTKFFHGQRVRNRWKCVWAIWNLYGCHDANMAAAVRFQHWNGHFNIEVASSILKSPFQYWSRISILNFEWFSGLSY